MPEQFQTGWQRQWQLEHAQAIHRLREGASEQDVVRGVLGDEGICLRPVDVIPNSHIVTTSGDVVRIRC